MSGASTRRETGRMKMIRLTVYNFIRNALSNSSTSSIPPHLAYKRRALNPTMAAVFSPPSVGRDWQFWHWLDCIISLHQRGMSIQKSGRRGRNVYSREWQEGPSHSHLMRALIIRNRHIVTSDVARFVAMAIFLFLCGAAQAAQALDLSRVDGGKSAVSSSRRPPLSTKIVRVDET